MFRLVDEEHRDPVADRIAASAGGADEPIAHL
jgi:hypothetical protein